MFIVAYLESSGFSPVQIGLIMGTAATTNLFGQLLWGVIADRYDVVHRLVPALLVGATLVGAVYLVVPHTLVTLLVITAVMSLFAQAVPPILDGWTMRFSAYSERITYGPLRAMGAVGFSVTVAVVGTLFDRWGLGLMFPLFVAVAGAAAGLSIWTNREFRGLRARAGAAGQAAQGALRLNRAALRSLVHRDVVTFLLLGLVSFSAFRAAQVYLPLLMTELGGTSGHLGLAFGVMAGSEVPFMILAGVLLARFRDVHVLLFTYAMFVVRIAAHVLAPDPNWLVAVQLIQGVCFGLYLPASVHFLDRLAPEGTKTLVQTLGSVFTFGMGSIVGSWTGGLAIEAFGVTNMYRIATALMFVAFVGFVVLFRHRLGNSPLIARNGTD